MPSEFFEEKQVFKREHYEEMIEKSKAEIQSLEKQNKEYGDATMGTPILIGHHSEKRHRREQAKVHKRMDKIVELYDKIKYYQNKIKNIDNPNAILSDDPEAVTKLKEKLADIESEIVKVKEHNKKCKTIFLEAFGYPTGTSICDTNHNYKKYCFVFDDKTLNTSYAKDGISWEAKRIPDEIMKRIQSWIKTGKFNQPELKDTEKPYLTSGLNSCKCARTHARARTHTHIEPLTVTTEKHTSQTPRTTPPQTSTNTPTHTHVQTPCTLQRLHTHTHTHTH